MRFSSSFASCSACFLELTACRNAPLNLSLDADRFGFRLDDVLSDPDAGGPSRGPSRRRDRERLPTELLIAPARAPRRSQRTTALSRPKPPRGPRYRPSRVTPLRRIP